MRKPLLSCFIFSLLLLLPFACTYDQVVIIEECENTLVVTLSDQSPSACGIASGSVTAAVSGEAAGVLVSYSLNGTDFQESPTFGDLAAGSYTLTARQGLCEAELLVVLDNAEGLNATAEVMPSACGSSSGSITITASEASGQVRYSLNGGAAQASATFSGLAPGEYQITAEDEIGCVVALTQTVMSDVAFAEVEAIVTASCAISGCHAGNVSPDFRVRDNILGRASRIGARTGNASMPPPSSGNSLSQAEIDAIACWITDGASQ